MAWGSERAGTAVVTLMAAVALLIPASALAAGSGSFTPTASMGTPRAGAAAAPLKDGRVLVAGGFDGSAPVASVEAFDPKTGTWSPLPPMPAPREFEMAAPLPDGRVLVAGGTSGTAIALQTALIFDPGTGTWTPTGNMVSPRSGSAVAPLADGRILIAGGINFLSPYDTAEVFNPQTGAFTAVGSMSAARQGKPTASPLPGGGALVAGGLNSGGSAAFDTAEAFNPQTNGFSTAGIGTMSTPRAEPVSAPLPDGRILVSGGIKGSTALASSEAFNPQTNGFSTAGIGALGTPRVAAAAAPLPDGRVLVAGGSSTGSSSQVLASAEIYSATNDFSFALQGRSLVVTVQATGKVTVADAASPLRADAAKRKRKKKQRPGLIASNASGDPPTITVPLALNKAAKVRLKRKRRVTVSVRITFLPQGGLAKTQTASLTIRGKGKKKKRK